MNKTSAITTIIILMLLGVRIFAYPQFIKPQPRPKNHIEFTTQTFPNKNVYLNVQYICQAPLQTKENWEHHEESCEEVASLMAYLYASKQTMTPEEADKVLLEMIDWQMENFKIHKDIYDQEVKDMIVGFFDIPEDDVKIIYNATIEDIKEQLDQGNPVIAPTTARLLENPHYPHPGYHMLVIKGYTPNTFITNDNGTKHGEDYEYQQDQFMKALEDAGGDVLTITIED